MTTSVAIVNHGPDHVRVLVVCEGPANPIPGQPRSVAVDTSQLVAPQSISSPVYVYQGQHLIVKEERL